jgi:acetyl esterase/lipase
MIVGSRTVLGIGMWMAVVASTWGQESGREPRVVPLWPEGVPRAQGTDPKLDVPTVTVYQPPPGPKPGAVVVICPGGGYGGLADHEGRPIAEWLNHLGVTGVVLKYRLGPRYHHPVMLEDAARAIRTVRARAEQWHVDPKRVAILGFSAGGHLASTAGTHFDAGHPDARDPVERFSSRPDLMILIYPVIALATPYAHAGSLRNLLGDHPPRSLVETLSNETQVTSETPPTFLVHTHEDRGVPAENSLLFALALRKAKVPVELHLYEKGPHGFGLGGKDPVLKTWPVLCAEWLKGRGFLDRDSAAN